LRLNPLDEKYTLDDIKEKLKDKKDAEINTMLNQSTKHIPGSC
jgi:hypothetical protein